MRTFNTICVFCGSSYGLKPSYRSAAAELGELLAAGGLTLVYGGGCVGLMGTVADAALGAGGEVIGVIPQALVAKEVSHSGLTKLHVVDSMHERKALMASLSDAFIALPGGFGTAEELCEILTWGQLGIHAEARRTPKCRWLLRFSTRVAGPCHPGRVHSDGASPTIADRHESEPPARENVRL